VEDRAHEPARMARLLAARLRAIVARIADRDDELVLVAEPACG